MNAPASTPLKCPAGTVLFQPGQECPGFVRLTKGKIRVLLTSASGREVVLYRVEPGGLCLQTFSCLVEGKTYSATGIAETDLEGEIISHSNFRKKLETDPSFLSSVLGAVATRFFDYERLVEDVALTSFDARLARALIRLADADDKVPATHEQLASETASGRAFVSRRLAEFALRGLVERHRGFIALIDKRGLERIAADDV
ncbi:Crp/Fnr family transcriptional regulator [Yoonia litorea]|uniref:Cyclic nucleotide-binding protein n=1 Tax=Yoonia litorea TaxID=1123755 RepID=A0A1I6MUY7_9RHOB|nr:Crp/Fnr family transcriptional regulator [Yoonia litorea]SFS19441.1 cyclic nucleotide-binding protein [Yoonia litorea]